MQVEEGQEAPVIHLSLLEIGGHRFLLQVYKISEVD